MRTTRSRRPAQRRRAGPRSTRAGRPIWTLGLLAVLVGVGFWVLLNKTRFGFDLRATGASQTAAVATGIKVNRMVLASMLLSGGVAGLIWMPAFFGAAYSYGTTVPGGPRLHRHRGRPARVATSRSAWSSAPCSSRSSPRSPTR